MDDARNETETIEDVLLTLVAELCDFEPDKQREWLQTLLETNEPTFYETNASGLTALHIAAANGSSAMLLLLLEKGARPTMSKQTNMTELPLHAAARTGRNENVELLLEFGSEVNDIDDLGRTALHTAATSGQTSTVQLLIKRRARLDVIDREGKTALLRTIANYASSLPSRESCSTACVYVLIENKARLDIQDCDERTALHHASASLSPLAPLLVETLLVHGATVDIPDKHGRTALQYASKLGLDVVMEALLKGGADVDWQDYQGFTALHHACASSCLSNGVHLVADHMADCGNESKERWPAFKCECTNTHGSAVNVLLDGGADASIQNQNQQKASGLTEDEGILDQIEEYSNDAWKCL